MLCGWMAKIFFADSLSFALFCCRLLIFLVSLFLCMSWRGPLLNSTALDAWENESIPKVSIDCNNVYFDRLEYKTRQTKIITITNTGKVGATFRFVPKLEDHYICKSWLSITPTFSMLLPNESIQIHVEANISSMVANGLQCSENVLDDILVSCGVVVLQLLCVECTVDPVGMVVKYLLKNNIDTFYLLGFL